MSGIPGSGFLMKRWPRGQTSADSTVRVSFLSRFSGKSCPVSIGCLDYARILCPVSVCPDFVCLISVRCPDSVRSFVKKPIRCLSVRILSASILSGVQILSGIQKNCPLSVCPAGQRQDRAVRTFAVLVRRRLLVGS